MSAFVQNIKTFTGKANWARVVGKPSKAYNPGENEWSIDLVLDEASLSEAHKLGMGSRVKKGVFKFTRSELKKAGPKKGEANKPITILKSDGTAWDQETLIGNGSDVKVKFNMYMPKPFGNKQFPPKAAILEVTVINLVPYEKGQKSYEAPAETWGEKV